MHDRKDGKMAVEKMAGGKKVGFECEGSDVGNVWM
jgi:hypothetical protein